MKRIWIAVVLGLLLSSSSYAVENGGAGGKKLGLGVVLGDPTGFSLKYWEGAIAYQGSLGAGFDGGLAIGLDYLIHTDAFRNPRFPFYYGPGLFLGDVGFGGPKYRSGDVFLGVRGVFGVDYIFPNHPFDIALELGPALLLVPQVGMGIELGIAFRFYP